MAIVKFQNVEQVIDGIILPCLPICVKPTVKSIPTALRLSLMASGGQILTGYNTVYTRLFLLMTN